MTTKAKVSFLCLTCGRTGQYFPNQKWCTVCNGRLIRSDRCMVCKQDRADIDRGICVYCADIVQPLVLFLAERKLSEGGYAPVAFEDMHRLREVIQALLEAKWGCDSDGDLPVDFMVVDRNLHQSSLYSPLPYPHNIETADQALAALHVALGNVKRANDDLAWVTDVLRPIFSKFAELCKNGM